MLKQNLTNHFIFVLDASGSMSSFEQDVVKAMDEQVANLVQMSKQLDQETRISVYTFDYANNIKNVVFDMDVMRYSTIAGQYKPDGYTALLDAIGKAYDDSKTISQLYTEHAFVIMVITDGAENASKRFNRLYPLGFVNMIKNSADNVTFSAMVPNDGCLKAMVSYGFDQGNVAIWEVSEKGIEEQTKVIAQSLGGYMTQRSTTGLKKSSNLFQVNADKLTQTDVRKAAQVLPITDFTKLYVDASVAPKTWISDYVESKLGSYKLGKAYYQLVKPEKIQPQKNINVRVS